MPFLEKFASIVKLFGGQNILIKGCTVFSDTKDGRRFISERRDRAAAVYLVFAGIKKEAKCVYAAVNYLNKARHKGRGSVSSGAAVPMSRSVRIKTLRARHRTG